jgi:hypothetical protein
MPDINDTDNKVDCTRSVGSAFITTEHYPSLKAKYANNGKIENRSKYGCADIDEAEFDRNRTPNIISKSQSFTDEKCVTPSRKNTIHTHNDVTIEKYDMTLMTPRPLNQQQSNTPNDIQRNKAIVTYSPSPLPSSTIASVISTRSYERSMGQNIVRLSSTSSTNKGLIEDFDSPLLKRYNIQTFI